MTRRRATLLVSSVTLLGQLGLLGLTLMLGLTQAPISARATVIQRVDFDTMTERASLVFYGTVTERFTHYRSREGAGSRAIVTTTSFDVHHVLKGPGAEGTPVGKGESIPLRAFQLTLAGGSLDGLMARIPGMPEFTPGERVVLFLEATPRGGYAVLGFDQGRFLVEDDADGTPIAVRRVRGAAVADPATGEIDGHGHQHGHKHEHGDHRLVDDLRIPLTQLFQRVRDLAADHGDAAASPVLEEVQR